MNDLQLPRGIACVVLCMLFSFNHCVMDEEQLPFIKGV